MRKQAKPKDGGTYSYKRKRRWHQNSGEINTPLETQQGPFAMIPILYVAALMRINHKYDILTSGSVSRNSVQSAVQSGSSQLVVDGAYHLIIGIHVPLNNVKIRVLGQANPRLSIVLY